MNNPYPIAFTQHEDRTIRLFLKQSNGSPLNLAGASIAAQVRDIELNLICNLNLQVSDAIGGMVLISPPVGGMPKWGRFVWDAVISIGGVDRFLPMSTCVVYPSVTRAGTNV